MSAIRAIVVGLEPLESMLEHKIQRRSASRVVIVIVALSTAAAGAVGGTRFGVAACLRRRRHGRCRGMMKCSEPRGDRDAAEHVSTQLVVALVNVKVWLRGANWTPVKPPTVQA